jgi:Fic family protein
MNDAIFERLGFKWDRASIPSDIPVHSVARVCFRFQRMLPEFVWDASVLEGNPFTFPEVQTLLDGITVGGKKLSDQEQVLNLAESSKLLLSLVKRGEFKLTKEIFCALQNIVARNEALEWGHFRGEGDEVNYTPYVGLGDLGRHYPLTTLQGAPALNDCFQKGLEALNEIKSPFERASAFFLFGALQQFFFDGNKRSSRLMMNGILMSEGIDAISIPASKANEFNEKMCLFYKHKDATDMFSFLVGCHPDLEHTAEKGAVDIRLKRQRQKT